MRLNALAVSVIALNVLIVLGIYYFGNISDISALVGVMSGAVTNTPGLAAAQQTITQMTSSPEQANLMASGYAAAYPLGVVGIILSMFVIKWIFRIKTDEEIKEIEKDQEESHLKPFILTVKVQNELIDGKTMVVLWVATDTSLYRNRPLRSTPAISSLSYALHRMPTASKP